MNTKKRIGIIVAASLAMIAVVCVLIVVSRNLKNKDSKDSALETLESAMTVELSDVPSEFVSFLSGENMVSVKPDCMVLSAEINSFSFDGNLADLTQNYYDFQNEKYNEATGELLTETIDDVSVEYSVLQSDTNGSYLMLCFHMDSTLNRYVGITGKEDLLQIFFVGDNSDNSGLFISDDGTIEYSMSKTVDSWMIETYGFQNQSFYKIFSLNTYELHLDENDTFVLNETEEDSLGIISKYIIGEETILCIDYLDESIEEYKEQIISDLQEDGVFFEYGDIELKIDSLRSPESAVFTTLS